MSYDRETKEVKGEYPEAVGDVQIIQGFEVYQDRGTMQYVAHHPDLPVSSCGDTVEEAVKNARAATEMYESPEGSETPNFE